MFVRSTRRAAAALAALAIATALATACSRGGPPALGTPPRAEFLVTTPDSTFWISTVERPTKVRGAPITIARIGGRFYELYAADDDRSYEDALLVGERLYRRDLVTGDSALVFADTMVPRLAEAYARTHPDEQPLRPDEEGEANPRTSATAEIDLLDVSGPYLSYEYHVDVELPRREPWHTTRRGVVDLRTGTEVTLRDLFGAVASARIVAQGRASYQATRDSIARERTGLPDDERRAADALASLPFDDRSFSLSTDDGALQVEFAVPGRGAGAVGNVLELDPVRADSMAWWTPSASGIPRADDAGNDHWTGAGYRVLARYDTSGVFARLSLADSSRREWPLAMITGPAERIDWLDTPAISAAERKALVRAFNQAASYDENARVAQLARRRSTTLRPVRLARLTRIPH